jgi:hypothetical protein
MFRWASGMCRWGRPHDAPFHEVIEFDLTQDHVHDPRQDLGDYPSNYEDSQENQNLRDRVDRRIKQILEALAYVNRSHRFARDFPL